MKKRCIASLTSMLMLIPAITSLVSCSSDNDTAVSETTAQAGETTAAESTVDTNSRENYPDSLPELDFEGAEIVIHTRAGDEFVLYEMGPEEEVGEVVADALYERNRSVEERLNVKLNINYGDSDSTKFSNGYHGIILAGDNVYDIIAAVQAAGIKFSHEGVFTNLADAEYIDYEKPWWNVEYMDEISVSSGVRYLLQGDISLISLRNLSAAFYNKALYESMYGDPDELYKFVIDGTWTYEMFMRIIEETYRDINGDSVTDIGDVLGSIGTAGSVADHYSFTAGMKMNDRDENGYPRLIEDQSMNIRVMETLDKLYFKTPGFYINSGGWSTEEPQSRGKLIDGSMMFRCSRLYEAEYFRDMEDPYGIIPFPKLDENQEDYKALVHNSTCLYTVPATVPTDKLDTVCAVLEAMCAQSYRTVTPSYFEVALKLKYSRDEMSGQVIDMLRDAMMTDFCYANSSSLNSIGTMARNLLSAGAGANYMSMYESRLSSVEKLLEEMIEKAQEIEDIMAYNE